jgi:N-methylhydantoinase A/oxoprolinase/acetone carboxylase beta subunit
MSSGGLTTLEVGIKYPIRLIDSGPAGGAILAGEIAKTFGVEQALSFDMGGTTAKIAPPAGPESISLIGYLIPTSSVVRPPLDIQTQRLCV